MKLNPHFHLAYCTNIHRGEDWSETFHGLVQYTLAVRSLVGRDQPFAIGLRLSCRAARELSGPDNMRSFRRWLDAENCYVFTINGFPFGRFHGGRVKEQVFRPDWASPERLEYTTLLFDILAELSPAGMEASVSTLPGSFKAFVTSPEHVAQIRKNLWSCIEHISRLSQKTGRDLHLGLEPEPLGLFENTAETVQFFEALTSDRPGDERLARHLGVNYDTCHFALQYEEPEQALADFAKRGIRISKVHLSSALKVRSNQDTCKALSAFVDEVYLHQVIERRPDGSMIRYSDLPLALAAAEKSNWPDHDWRVHFHIPLHSPKSTLFQTTASHIKGVFNTVARQPRLCSHFEIETYTWEVLPPGLKNENVVTQIAREYDWCFDQMKQHGIAISR